MERNAQQGTQDGIPTGRRISRPTREQGDRYLVLGIGDHGLERRRGEVGLGVIQGQRQQSLPRTLPRQTRHEFHGDAPRFDGLGFVRRDLGRGIEKRLERRRQTGRLMGRKISRKQSEPDGLRRRRGNLEFSRLGQRASEVAENLRHTRADPGFGRPDRQKLTEEGRLSTADAAEDAVAHPLVLGKVPGVTGQRQRGSLGRIIAILDDASQAGVRRRRQDRQGRADVVRPLLGPDAPDPAQIFAGHKIGMLAHLFRKIVRVLDDLTIHVGDIHRAFGSSGQEDRTEPIVPGGQELTARVERRGREGRAFGDEPVGVDEITRGIA